MTTSYIDLMTKLSEVMNLNSNFRIQNAKLSRELSKYDHLKDNLTGDNVPLRTQDGLRVDVNVDREVASSYYVTNIEQAISDVRQELVPLIHLMQEYASIIDNEIEYDV